jgi:predicted amidohydrolase
MKIALAQINTIVGDFAEIPKKLLNMYKGQKKMGQIW